MGEFSLTYGFVDDLTTCANEATATVAVQAPLEPQISAPDLACVNAPVELALVDSVGFSQIQWYVGEEWEGLDSIASWSPAEEGTWTSGRGHRSERLGDFLVTGRCASGSTTERVFECHRLLTDDRAVLDC